MIRSACILVAGCCLAGCLPSLEVRECFGNDECSSDRRCRGGRCVAIEIDASIEADAEAGQPEAGAPDAEAGRPDAEAGVPEAGEPEAGEPDAEAGPPEAGEPDAEAGIAEDAAERVRGAIVDYTFDEGVGDVVLDRSGVPPALDLVIADPSNTTWLAGSLRIDAATIIESSTVATKIRDACAATQAVTIEAWAASSDPTQAGPARIFTLAQSAAAVDLLLGQGGPPNGPFAAFVVGRVQTTTGNASGANTQIESVLDLGATPTHLVLVRPSNGEFRLYHDLQAVTSTPGGTLDWFAGSTVKVGNEYEVNALARTWLGTIHRAAIYCFALTPAEVMQNFTAGP
jgi:hypothetical protein